MKVSSILWVIVAVTPLVTVPLIAAEKGNTPTAPKEYKAYLKMKNPFKAGPDVLEAAKSLYDKHCKKCHGENGDGEGPAAKDLNPLPKDFRDPLITKAPDGHIFWSILTGSPDTDMGAFGPSSEKNLSEDDIWKLVVYIRHLAK